MADTPDAAHRGITEGGGVARYDLPPGLYAVPNRKHTTARNVQERVAEVRKAYGEGRTLQEFSLFVDVLDLIASDQTRTDAHVLAAAALGVLK